MIRGDKAPITALVEFRTTTPIPAQPSSLNVAPSKLILRWDGSGGVHLATLATIVEATGCDYWAERKS